MARGLTMFTLGAGVGIYAGWTLSRKLSLVEQQVGPAAPRPVAKQPVDYFTAGGAEARRMKKLEERLQEHMRQTAESMAELTRQAAEHHRQLLALVIDKKHEED